MATSALLGLVHVIFPDQSLTGMHPSCPALFNLLNPGTRYLQVCPFAGCLLSFPASIFLHIVFFRTMWPNNFISLSAILFVNIKTDPILSNNHLFVLLSTHDTLNSLRSLSLSPKLIPATVLLCSPLRGPMTPAVVY